MTRLLGKRVLLTGAAGGQGRAEAELFLAEGAHVMLGDIDEAVADLATALGEGARHVSLDVTDERSWEEAVDHTISAFAGLDVLVNNAGVFRPKPLMETKLAEYDFHHRVNELGTFLGIRAAVEPLTRAGGGSIVNTSSIVGVMGGPNVIAYGASKFAVRGMTHCAAIELAPRGIRVNSIHPGVVQTPMLDVLPAGTLDHMLAVTPLARTCRPEEVAQLALFLASDESSYCTGAEFRIDGGASA